ncbi:hypothetical protein ANO14919_085040 [Xylariales sp. No.14919]|nr:hypothetical protein ANO14919_085040 [Xylariales sp. No.14919]
MRFELALTSAAVAAATPLAAQSAPVQLFSFPGATPIENSALRSDSQLLLTTTGSNELYQLNPLAESPEAKPVAVFPGITALTGIAEIAPGKFAVQGGVPGNGTYQYYNATVYTVDFGAGGDAVPTVEAVAEVPDSILLNGLVALPLLPHIVLSTDSVAGCIWRIDTVTGAVDKAITDAALEVPANATTPLGANGLKIHGGHVYFTNTGAGLFARALITPTGDRIGDVEVIATVPAGTNWDDLAIDAAGVAYLSQSPGAVVRITRDGTSTFVVGADDDTSLSGRPTSITLPKGGKKAYITTGGGTAAGKVFEISL